jgi:tRNA threonylcarbamoyladenosine biosynthesis protein TsaE
MMTSYRTTSEQETRQVARSMAAVLRGGDVVALYGDLGTGKTQFVKGLCEAFHVQDPVTSPTFVILNRYAGMEGEEKDIFIFHFDLYRVQNEGEMYDLGYEEFLFGNGICVIEWADRLESLLPESRYDVSLSFGESEEERNISINPVGIQIASHNQSGEIHT